MIFCDKESKRWFLSAPKKKDDFTCRCFHNHLKVLPSHLSTPTNKIPPAVEDYITNPLNVSESIKTIIGIIRVQYSITMTEEQIKRRRTDYIDDMIKQLEG